MALTRDNTTYKRSAAKNSYLPILDSIRGYAALWVFALHCYPRSTPPEASSAIDSFLLLGYLGVPIFFVVSGYCISAAAEASLITEHTALRFLFRRFFRVYPTFWCSALLIFFLAALPPLFRFLFEGKFAYHPQPWMAFTPNTWLQVVSLFPGPQLETAIGSINGVYWTLVIEVQFYCVVAFLVFLKTHFWRNFAIVTVLSVVATFAGLLTTSTSCAPYWPLFSIGGLIYWLRTRQHFFAGIWRLQFWAMLFLTGIAVASFEVQYARHGLGKYYSVTAVLTGFLIWLSNPPETVYTSRPEFKWIVSLLSSAGLMSYSLYLVHYPVNRFFIKHISFLGRPAAAGSTLQPAANFIDLLRLAVVIIVAYAFYVFCERPIHSRLQRKQRQTANPD
ncbi:MAG: acyltransferase [Planctomycetaceae bacterium]|nr:acyltransferase [Planctomycetaceae bacterium]